MPTPQDTYADIVLREKTGEILPQIAEQVSLGLH